MRKWKKKKRKEKLKRIEQIKFNNIVDGTRNERSFKDIKWILAKQKLFKMVKRQLKTTVLKAEKLFEAFNPRK